MSNSCYLHIKVFTDHIENDEVLGDVLVKVDDLFYKFLEGESVSRAPQISGIKTLNNQEKLIALIYSVRIPPTKRLPKGLRHQQLFAKLDGLFKEIETQDFLHFPHFAQYDNSLFGE